MRGDIRYIFHAADKNKNPMQYNTSSKISLELQDRRLRQLERSVPSHMHQTHGDLTLISITCAFILTIIFSIIGSVDLSEIMHNGAYKAVVWFLILIFDSNLTSKYLGFVIPH